ncbi:MAG: hypothetical protein M3460_02810 [Actinomycetota bacterium]|nr:hypothetical protein [Actinomycetota bacterium]
MSSRVTVPQRASAHPHRLVQLTGTQRGSHGMEIHVDLGTKPVRLGLHDPTKQAAQPVDLRADHGRVAALAIDMEGQLLRGQPFWVQGKQFRAAGWSAAASARRGWRWDGCRPA